MQSNHNWDGNSKRPIIRQTNKREHQYKQKRSSACYNHCPHMAYVHWLLSSFIFFLCLTIKVIPTALERIPIAKNHGWDLTKKIANPETPAIGRIFSRKWLQHAIILPPEIAPVPTTVPVSCAVCFIETNKPICVPNPITKRKISFMGNFSRAWTNRVLSRNYFNFSGF